MASYTVPAGEIGVHETLVASTADSVTFTDDITEVEVLNRDGAAEIYFTVDGSTPTVGGENCRVLPAAIGGLELRVEHGDVVKLISSGTPTYSVSVVQ